MSSDGPRVLLPQGWQDYELLDSGSETKLERFGPYRLARPESAAGWPRSLPERAWRAADGAFTAESGGEPAGWRLRGDLAPRWKMTYKELSFWVQPMPFRHVGLFPEQAVQWQWIERLMRDAGRPLRVLCLFGYTGLATLVAAAAGAAVTHVDASKKAVAWARENQALSGLDARPVRWIVDDALKFARREVRRGASYDGFILDPPVFGHGPKGEIWRLEDSLPPLLATCRQLAGERPRFVVLTAYATRLPAWRLQALLDAACAGCGGQSEAGELGLQEKSAGHIIPTAIYARWHADQYG